ncbi:DUF723 domain-containing protein [Psychrobacter sp. I-STPA6b]|uniref:DUF723 domain-containing protein n=1 Tax=Psychrobacter sp. I-STPA6b TaxID=2585718 RepID=UPI001D0C38CD|nr:DUF723 domain-containing protein [Psychrobacter sp. I-STPA6b]
MTVTNTTRYIKRGQSRMPLLYSTEQIVERFKSVHGNKYDYSLVDYQGSDCHVSIICKKHGVFKQRADLHLGGSNCPKCAKRHKPTTEEFILDCSKTHGKKFNYSKTCYKNSRNQIIVTCLKHGDFKVLPYAHKSSKNGGCLKCNPNKRLTQKDFIEAARVKHNNFYDYKEVVNFKNVRAKIPITCPMHGSFTQIADQHLRGRGCPECAKELAHGFTRTGYIDKCKKTSKGKSRLYVIKCSGNNEEFFKVGITSTSLKRRFNSVIPYDYKEIFLIEEEAGFIWDLEIQIHRLMKKYAYKPLLPFGGDTECFGFMPKKIFNFLSEIKSSNQLNLIT